MGTIQIDHDFYMNLALDAAWQYQGLTYSNPAVGALILDPHGKILSIAAHKQAGGPHAEVLAIQEAFLTLHPESNIRNLTDSQAIHDYLRQHAWDSFQNCTIYVTLEPCHHHGKTPPCSQLIHALGFSQVAIGHPDPNPNAAGGASYLYSQNIQVTGGICQEECGQLLYPFSIWNERPFIFFKWAQRLNGTVDGGMISSESTLDFIHQLRDRIDLLVIGGNTVRTDRPTLNARRIQGHSPDVLIYSKQRDFDLSIPLFSVPNRKVHISDSLDLVQTYRFIMIEGGPAMLEACQHLIDWKLMLLSPASKPGKAFTLPHSSGFLHSYPKGNDLICWMK